MLSKLLYYIFKIKLFFITQHKFFFAVITILCSTPEEYQQMFEFINEKDSQANLFLGNEVGEKIEKLENLISKYSEDFVAKDVSEVENKTGIKLIDDKLAKILDGDRTKRLY